ISHPILPSLLLLHSVCSFFFFSNPPPPEFHTLPLHDALPICPALVTVAPAVSSPSVTPTPSSTALTVPAQLAAPLAPQPTAAAVDRKSTRLNSSHVSISYAVFCLKKKKKKK